MLKKIGFVILFSNFFSAFVLASSLGDFPSVEARLGNASIQTLYVAGTDPLRQRGLMEVRSLPESSAMLFVFESARPLQFWMKNTFIPLSIGFFDEQGCLLEVQDMKPVASVLEINIPRYESHSDAQFALEANKGWFQKHKIEVNSPLILTKAVGSKVRFQAEVQKALERLQAQNRCKTKKKN